jgi:hypothetical protein
MNKEEAKKIIDNGKGVEVWHSKWFAYPSYGAEPKTCILLDAMLKIEHRAGTILFIPEDK